MNSAFEKSKLHCINLHGPWQAEVIDCESDLELIRKKSKAKIPFDWKPWLGSEFHGRISMKRSFGRPTNLRDNQEVWLVVELELNGCISLNDCNLGSLQSSQAAWRAEVSDLLLRRNSLRIDFSISPQEWQQESSWLFRGAKLEITSDE